MTAIYSAITPTRIERKYHEYHSKHGRRCYRYYRPGYPEQLVARHHRLRKNDARLFDLDYLVCTLLAFSHTGPGAVPTGVAIAATLPCTGHSGEWRV